MGEPTLSYRDELKGLQILEQGTAPFHIPEKIIGVEVCAEKYAFDRKNAMATLDALPEFEDLLSSKNFMLKGTNASHYLSKDSRKVFKWQSDNFYLWKNIQLRRPTRFIAYLVAYGYASDRWTDADYPPPTDENKKKDEEKHKTQLAKEETLKLRKQEAAVRRAEKAALRKQFAERIKAELGLIDPPKKKKRKLVAVEIGEEEA
jgi:hypothetical protein